MFALQEDPKENGALERKGEGIGNETGKVKNNPIGFRKGICLAEAVLKDRFEWKEALHSRSGSQGDRSG